MASPDLDKDVTKHRFQDRVYIVTGGSDGIGLATTERLCNDGATVAIFARNQDRGKEVESRLQAQGYRVRFYSVDVSREEECERGVQEVVRDFGDVIHGLVNNAAILQTYSKGEDLTAAALEETLATNVKAAVYLVKSCLPHLKKGQNATIVNISSIGSRATPRKWSYNASKGALESLSRSMALDLNAYGIRVNTVTPGPIITKMMVGPSGLTRLEVGQRFGKMTMMNRSGEPSEVASAIAFMLSKDASFITGANLYVDGGCNAMCPPVGQ